MRTSPVNLKQLVVALCAVGLILSACGDAASGDSARRCDDGIERFDCTEQWETEFARYLGMRDPDEIMGRGQVGDERSIDEQLNAAAEFQAFALAVMRAEQACQLMQGIEPSGSRLRVEAETATWLSTNVCPGDPELVTN